jgi:2-amino-4-hydroxy-6-hydroxymethyldihydropteridine diphosphokinase
MVRAAIALGSNVGDRRAALHDAVAQLDERLGDLHVSDFIETEPEGVGPQPRFLNGAAVGTWRGDARSLLDLLLAIEQALGRDRPFPGAPRVIDLDLILFGSAVIDEPGLTVPHPRFRARRFVLEPLSQIAPEMVDPVTGLTMADLFRTVEEP